MTPRRRVTRGVRLRREHAHASQPMCIYGRPKPRLRLPSASCSAGAMPLHPDAVSEFRFIPPGPPGTAKSGPAGDDWLHEPNLDGYRLQIAKHGRVMRLYSRRGHDWSKRLSALTGALRGIPAHSAVVDA